MSDAASPLRVSFDFTPADLADVTVANALGTAWARRAQRRSAIVGGVIGMAAVIPIMLLLGGVPDADELLVYAGLLLPLGVTIGLAHYVQFEFSMHRRVVRALTVELGDVVLRCDVELRDEGLWVRQRSVEILYHWNDLKSVDDRPSGIGLRFGDGYVLVRSRAFATRDERDVFLAEAKARMP